jgi:putative ABC transport system substrate-binding protein
MLIGVLAFTSATFFTTRNPGELPVELSAKYEFVFNIKTAKNLGLKVPNSFVLLADEIIE